MIDKFLLKTVCISSIITGAIIGVIPLIPAFLWIAIITLMFLVAPFITLYLKHLGLIKEIEAEQTAVISTVSGAFAVVGFCIVYLPIALILHLIFKIPSFMWVKVMFVNFGYLLPMIFFTSLLCALLNGFSGFMTVYFYNAFSKKK